MDPCAPSLGSHTPFPNPGANTPMFYQKKETLYKHVLFILPKFFHRHLEPWSLKGTSLNI
jgi:hypothetical protein